MNDGLDDRYTVQRNDGRDAPGEKHHGCRYFVIDLDHDPAAPIMLQAYGRHLLSQGRSSEADSFFAAAADRRGHGSSWSMHLVDHASVPPGEAPPLPEGWHEEWSAADEAEGDET